MKRQNYDPVFMGNTCVKFKPDRTFVWQQELINILNLGSGTEVKLRASLYHDVIMWAEAYLVTS